jgi:nucleoid-associated protein YgaU
MPDPVKVKKQRISDLEQVIKQHDFKVENLSIDLDNDTVTVYGQTESQAEKEKVILSLGNVEGIATVDDRISVLVPEPESKFYEVKSGDSLSKIAKSFYGDAMKYPLIFEANRPMLKDPDKIYPGQVLRIPPIQA